MNVARMYSDNEENYSGWGGSLFDGDGKWMQMPY